MGLEFEEFEWKKTSCFFLSLTLAFLFLWTDWWLLLLGPVLMVIKLSCITWRSQLQVQECEPWPTDRRTDGWIASLWRPSRQREIFQKIDFSDSIRARRRENEASIDLLRLHFTTTRFTKKKMMMMTWLDCLRNMESVKKMKRRDLSFFFLKGFVRSFESSGFDSNNNNNNNWAKKLFLG